MKKGLIISLIIGIVCLVAGFVLTDFHIDESSYSYTNKEEIHTLKMNCDISDIKIEKGNEFKIITENLPEANEKSKGIAVKITEQDGVYTFKTNVKRKRFFSRKEFKVIVQIPEELKNLEMDLNVGNLKVEGLELETLKADMAVGDYTAENCKISDLKVNCDLGSIEYEGDVIDKMDMKCAVGDIDIKLDRAYEMYIFDVKCDLGKTNIEKGMQTRPEAKTRIECRLDVGNCEIEFDD